MGKCASGIFTILTLLTIGCTFALFVFATVVFVKIKSASNEIFIVIIICLGVSFLILIFGIYASCCGNNCVKGVLSILYIIYAFAIGALGVALIIFQKKLPEYFDKAYYDGTLSNTTQDMIVEAFNCKFPPKNKRINDETPKDCLDKFKDYVHNYGLICGIALIVLFILLFIGVCFAIHVICKKDQDLSNAKSREQEQMNQPLTYGW